MRDWCHLCNRYLIGWNLSQLEPSDLKLDIASFGQCNESKEVKKNIVKGRIDIIIGLDQLYGKFSNTNSIRHPYKRLALLNSIFGFSIGGSTEDYLDGGTKLDILVSNLEMKTEPTAETNKKKYPTSNEQTIRLRNAGRF